MPCIEWLEITQQKIWLNAYLVDENTLIPLKLNLETIISRIASILARLSNISNQLTNQSTVLQQIIDLINALDPPRIFYKNEELPERIQFLPSNDKSSLKNSKFTSITF